MTQVMLQCSSEATKEPCGICGCSAEASAGMRFVLAGTSTPVCHECARRQAPPLAALVSLADAATRIGRIGRHSVFPPLTALLDLASAAEKYAQTTQPAAST